MFSSVGTLCTQCPDRERENNMYRSVLRGHLTCNYMYSPSRGEFFPLFLLICFMCDMFQICNSWHASVQIFHVSPLARCWLLVLLQTDGCYRRYSLRAACCCRKLQLLKLLLSSLPQALGMLCLMPHQLVSRHVFARETSLTPTLLWTKVNNFGSRRRPRVVRVNTKPTSEKVLSQRASRFDCPSCPSRRRVPSARMQRAKLSMIRF